MAVTVYKAAAVRDVGARAGLGTVDARPGAVALADGQVVLAGEIPSVMAAVAGRGDLTEVDLGAVLLLPGMVNAHTHLELTAIGPTRYPGAFMDWAGELIQRRPVEPDAVADSVRTGAAMLRASGVVAVGDIGSPVAYAGLSGSGLRGRFYAEVLGYGGERVDEALSAFASLSEGEVKLGLQPHAPYTTSRSVYERCVQQGVPVCTHLAEMREEETFVRDGRGAFREHFQQIGFWDPTAAGDYGRGESPVQWMQPWLSAMPWLLAHCNYVDDADIELLRAAGASVAYCPIASEYFGHTGHRYREMLAAGVNVCLGTDSILCQPAEEAQPLGLLAPMRRLHQRDGTASTELLAMVTVHGAKALQLSRTVGTLSSGAPGVLLACNMDPTDPTDALTQVLTRSDPPFAVGQDRS